MDIQTDVGDVVQMFAGGEPDDLADLAFGIVARHASKRVRVSGGSILVAPSHSRTPARIPRSG